MLYKFTFRISRILAQSISCLFICPVILAKSLSESKDQTESLSESKDRTESLSESKDRTSQLGALRKALWDGRANWKDIGIDLKIAAGTLKVCIVRYSVICIAVRIFAACYKFCM